MRSRTIIATFILALLIAAMTLPGAVLAQQDGCGTVISYSLAPGSGPAGSTATASGSGAMLDDTVNFYWDSTMGAMVGSASTDMYGNYSAVINIPADATVGDHVVILTGTDAQENSVECPQPFTVVAATAQEGVQPDAYLSVGKLPSTGFTIIAPAAGLLLTGAALAYRKRSR